MVFTVATQMKPLIVIRVHGKPAPKGSMRAVIPRFSRSRRPILVHDNERTKQWQDSVALAARGAFGDTPPTVGAVSVQMAFFLPRPRTVNRACHTVKPDIDKLVRCVLDGLTGIAYLDDAQVNLVKASKGYAKSKEELGVDIVVAGV